MEDEIAPSSPHAFLERVVLPGDDVTTALTSVTSDLRIGAGLHSDAAARIRATKAGVLAFRSPNRFFVLTNQRRYTAAVGDNVVGVIIDRAAEWYVVRLHGTRTALLPHLAFDGATKRNKPELRPGALIFARIASTSRHMDPELSCAVASGPKRDWMTGAAVFGELKGGTLVHLSTGTARRLMEPTCALLSTLGAAVPFEAAVGLNGLAWVQASSAGRTAAVARALERVDEEALSEEACAELGEEVAAAMKYMP
jgi:exosome complex component RRP40